MAVIRQACQIIAHSGSVRGTAVAERDWQYSADGGIISGPHLDDCRPTPTVLVKLNY